MAKPKKTSRTRRSTTSRPSWLRGWWQSHRDAIRAVGLRVLCWSLIAVVTAGATWAAMWAARRAVRARQYSRGEVRYTVELQSVESWMPAELVRTIRRDMTPNGMAYRDPALCRTVYALLADQPWVADVRSVRRCRLGPRQGRVVVDVEYRRPVARVRKAGRLWYVDADGVRLPELQVPRWAAEVDGEYRYYLSEEAVPAHLRTRRVHYPGIDGVAGAVPAVGCAWGGEDIADALRLVEMIRHRPWGNQVTVIDVQNHGQRITPTEPEIRMYAQMNFGGQATRPTDIRFGRFPRDGGGDWIISPARKLQYLDEYVERNEGQLAGVNHFLDLRYDELRVSFN